LAFAENRNIVDRREMIGADFGQRGPVRVRPVDTVPRNVHVQPYRLLFPEIIDSHLALSRNCTQTTQICFNIYKIQISIKQQPQPQVQKKIFNLPKFKKNIVLIKKLISRYFLGSSRSDPPVSFQPFSCTRHLDPNSTPKTQSHSALPVVHI
jgi:hypothetical protein